MADYVNDVLVEPEWLEQHLNDDSVRIVEVDENPALYKEAHIPGAIGFDWRLDLQDQVKRDFLGPEEFGALFGSRGVSNDHLIVLYGDRNNWFAAYTYWYLKYYGHDNVKLLNGPRERWIAEGRPTTTDVPDYAASPFSARPGNDSIRAKRDEVLSALHDSHELVDVRSPQEYSGELIAMPGTRARALSAPATSRAPSRSPGRRRSRRMGRSSQPTSCATCTAARAFCRASRSSPTAGSVSARRTPGSSSTSCSASRT